MVRICCCGSSDQAPLAGAAEGEKEVKMEHERRSCLFRSFVIVSVLLLMLLIVLSMVLHMPSLLGMYGHTAQKYIHEVSASAGFPLENITHTAIQRVRSRINQWPDHFQLTNRNENATTTRYVHPRYFRRGPHGTHRHGAAGDEARAGQLIEIPDVKLMPSAQDSLFARAGDAVKTTVAHTLPPTAKPSSPYDPSLGVGPELESKTYELDASGKPIGMAADEFAESKGTVAPTVQPSASDAPHTGAPAANIAPASTVEPSAHPTAAPTAHSTTEPTVEPARIEPKTAEPTAEPTRRAIRPSTAAPAVSEIRERRPYADEVPLTLAPSAYDDEYSQIMQMQSALLGRARARGSSMAARRWVTEGADNLYFTMEAQQFLVEHQHPPTCDDASFLVWTMPNQGIAFDLRSLSYAMALALQHNRVLLIDRGTGWYWLDQEITPSSPEFFFDSVSSCSMEHAIPVAELQPGQTMSSVAHIKSVRAHPLAFDVNGGLVTVDQELEMVPDLFVKLFGQHTDPSHAVDAHWWRAQASRYLFRGLDATYRLEFLSETKQRLEIAGRPLPADSVTQAVGLLPTSITLFIRHGVDEYGSRHEEHEAVPLPDNLSFTDHYLPLANALKSLHPELDTLFIVTNDPAVIQEASQQTEWTVVFHTETRHPMTAKAAVGSGVSTPLVEAHKVVGNLLWAVQAKHFVCPTETHFCRLLNELRLTGDRKSAKFVTPVPQQPDN